MEPFNILTILNANQNEAAAQQKPATDSRRATRFVVKWRSAVILDITNQKIYHGWLKDISVSGTAVFSDKSIPHSSSAELHIEVPAVYDQKERILALDARIVYGVYDTAALQFRTGIEFVKFSSSNDQLFLGNHLKKHCQPRLG